MSNTKLTTIVAKIDLTTEDGHVNGTTFTDGNTILIGHNGTNAQKAFMLFKDLPIPKGSTITAANIRMIAQTAGSNADANVQIYGNLAAIATSPTDNTTYDAKVVTTAFTNWTNIAAWTAGKVYESPDISAVIQEVIDQTSWAEGAPILILIKNNSSTSNALRTFYARNDGTVGTYFQPRLIVTYERKSTALSSPPASGDPLSWVKLSSAAILGSTHQEDMPVRPSLVASGTGSLSGLYTYQISYLIGDPMSGEFVETSPSDKKSVFTNTNTVTVKATLPDESNITGYRIYRSLKNESTTYLLATIMDPITESYVDNKEDDLLDTNQTPSSSSVNSLSVIWQNALFPYPKNNIVPVSKDLTVAYQPSSDKRFYITNLALGSTYSTGNHHMCISDGVTLFPIYSGRGSKFYSSIPVHTTLQRTGSNIVFYGSGVLGPKNDGIIPIIRVVTNSSPYVVPADKAFFLLGTGIDANEFLSYGNQTVSSSTQCSTTAYFPVASCLAIDCVASNSTTAITVGGSQTQLNSGTSPFAHSISSCASAVSMDSNSLVGATSQSLMVLRPNGTITKDADGNSLIKATATDTTTVSWSGQNVTGANSNRIMIVAIMTKTETGTGASVKSVVGSDGAFTKIRQDGRGDVRTELWAYLSPAGGTGRSGTVTFEETVKNSVVVSMVYYNVEQNIGNNMLRAKTESTGSALPVLAVSDGHPFSREGGAQRVPGYCIFGPADELSCSSTISAGVTIYGYEVYKQFL